ncbi:MAG: isochorismatase family protein [Deltaproteobacteria bacterium]|jgi:nicotinamidase-related amidase
MKKQNKETPALLIIDMVKDNFIESRNLSITPFALAIIHPLNKLIDVFRGQNWPVVFSTDAFHEDDFICVLTTVLDAICNDFKAVLLEDCSAASSKQIHERTLDNYRRNALYPLLRVIKSTDLVSELL